MTYEADQDGALKIVAQEGDTLAVGETIAQIGGGSDGARQRRRRVRGGPQARSPPRRRPASRTRRADRRGRGGAGDDGAAEPSRREEAPARAPEPSRRRQRRPRQGVPGGAADGARARARARPAPGHRPGRPDRQGRRRGRRQGRRRGRGAGAGGGSSGAAPEAEPEEKKAPPPVVSGDAQTGKGETTTQDLTRLQQTVARRMAESKATAPDFVLNIDVDMEEAVDLRKRLKAAAGEGQPVPSFNDFVVKASGARAARLPARQRRLPRRQVRALLARQRRRRGRGPGRARGPDDLRRRHASRSAQIARDARALAERVRAGRDHPARALVRHVHGLEPRHVRDPELRGGHQPAAGRDPRGRRDAADARWCATARSRSATIMRLTLACDHRILYGADAAEFLGRIRERLENPLQLAL